MSGAAPLPSRRMQRAALALALLLGLCGPARAGELTISAAVSLETAFKAIGASFEQAEPQARLTFNFAASGVLLQQIERGAPVDVFATADQETMDRAAAGKLIMPASRKSFAGNRLVLVVPASNFARVLSLTDLKRQLVKRIAIGAPASVPAGRYARDALLPAGAWDVLQPKLIYAESVRQVLDYVARGEVDAGFVYLTDAQIANGRVQVVAELATSRPVG